MNVGVSMMWFSTLKKTDFQTELTNNIDETFPEIKRFLNAYFGSSSYEVWPKLTDSLIAKITGSEVSMNKRNIATEYWSKKDLKNMNVYLSVKVGTAGAHIRLSQISFVITAKDILDRKEIYNVNQIVIYPPERDDYLGTFPKDDNVLFGFDLIREWIILLPSNYKVSILHIANYNLKPADIKEGHFDITFDGQIRGRRDPFRLNSPAVKTPDTKVKKGIMEIYNNSEIVEL